MHVLHNTFYIMLKIIKIVKILDYSTGKIILSKAKRFSVIIRNL